jgi:hypothetical protein
MLKHFSSAANGIIRPHLNDNLRTDTEILKNRHSNNHTTGETADWV